MERLPEHRVQDLLSFMRERQEIYLRRLAGGPPPWTKDEILQKYRFCNVYREQDTVTKWIDEHIRKPYAKHPNLWFMLAIARQINLPETLGELIDTEERFGTGCWPLADYNWKALRKVLLFRKKRGAKVYTGAYMLNAQLGKQHAGCPSDKAYFTAKIVLDAVWRDRNIFEAALNTRRGSPGCTLQEAHSLFLPYHGWGGFMAYEVVSDLRWTRYLAAAADVYSWAHAGPGAKRGLQRIIGMTVKSPLLSDSDALNGMRELLVSLSKKWPRSWKPLEMREVEHSLCEFDKYERVRNNEGRPRAKFNPTMES